jgi:hypothetical protein
VAVVLPGVVVTVVVVVVVVVARPLLLLPLLERLLLLMLVVAVPWPRANPSLPAKASPFLGGEAVVEWAAVGKTRRGGWATCFNWLGAGQ